METDRVVKSLEADIVVWIGNALGKKSQFEIGPKNLKESIKEPRGCGGGGGGGDGGDGGGGEDGGGVTRQKSLEWPISSEAPGKQHHFS